MTNTSGSEVVSARDGLPGCPVIMWDGPYNMRCSLGVDVCSIHGLFEVRQFSEAETALASCVRVRGS